MKRTVLFILVVIIAALSVMSVSAAPHGRYFDQIGNKHWCTSDSYGCWVTGEDGGKNYIMFWSEAAAEAIMGKNSGAPIGAPLSGSLNLAGPKINVVAVAEEDDKENPPKDKCEGKTCGDGEHCEEGKCVKDQEQTPVTPTDPCKDVNCSNGQKCVDGTCVADTEGQS